MSNQSNRQRLLFLKIEQLPQRIIFVGGGYISSEFAHVAVRDCSSSANRFLQHNL